jgi:DNA-binding transcriptional ArsR family regulator
MPAHADPLTLADLAARLGALEKQVAALTAKPSPASPADVLTQLHIACDQISAVLPLGEHGLTRLRDRAFVAGSTDLSGQGEVALTTLGLIIEEEDDAGLAALAAAVSNPARIRALKLLAADDRSAKDLGEAIGLEGGPLYHHLKALAGARLIVQPERSRYRISPLGINLLGRLGGLHRAARLDGHEPDTTIDPAEAANPESMEDDARGDDGADDAVR